MNLDYLTNPFVHSALLALIGALIVGLFLLRFRGAIGPLTRVRHDHLAVQASHTGNPLRLGGLTVIVGVLIGLSPYLAKMESAYTSLLLASVVPVFLAGLWEDLGFGVSAKGRFFAAAVSATTSVSLLGFWVGRGDLPGLDAALGFAPVGIILTILVAAVFCHAVNLIDGMNGLAATVVIFSGLGIAQIASQADLSHVAHIAILLAAATFGFELLNWPSAKLFLGDAGAYGLGHLLAWLGISLVALAPNVALPAVLLTLFYPFIDTLHTVLRRLSKDKKIMVPDRMHLHQKIRRGLEIAWIGRDRRHVSNPLTTAVLAPFIAAPVLAGVLFWDRPMAAWIAFAGFTAAFAGTHILVMALARNLRKTARATTPLSPLPSRQEAFAQPAEYHVSGNNSPAK